MTIKMEITKGAVPVKIYTDEIEPDALRQLINISRLPFIHSHVTAMPDVHLGIGATVGAVIPTRAAIIPAAVGVDIGCGMCAVRLSLHAHQLPDSLARLRAGIEMRIPVGFAQHDKPCVPRAVLKDLEGSLDTIVDKHPQLMRMVNKFSQTWASQLGSLGGGNHFIELCLDERNQVWVMLHSGSRGIGNAIGRHFIALAKQDMEHHLSQLPDKDLAYFKEGTAYFDDYVAAVHWAQRYAFLNREAMLKLLLEVLKEHLPPFTVTAEAINCHHNYVAVEQHFGEQVYLTRKGAISAREGELGIIPGSMGARSYIVRGKGNPESFHSCAHGAGRRMSRAEAKRRFNRKDLEAQTQGVECRKDKGVIDEIPGAYKSIDQVMAHQTDLVDVVHTLKQVLCVKG
jgi:tRNA-splicing ligase RtcB